MLFRDGFRYLPVAGIDIHREIYVTSLGKVSYAPGEAYPCGGHPMDYNFQWQRGRVLGDFAVVFLTRGQGEFEDQVFGLIPWKAGVVLILPPGVWHRYRPLRGVGWTEIWMTANGEYLHRLRAKGFFPRTSLLRQLSEPAVFGTAFARLWTAPHFNSMQLCSHALALLACALEGHEVAHRGMEPSPTGNDAVDRALEFIWLNSHRTLDVTSIATAVGLTRRTLERRFAQVHVRHVAEEIEWCRVERAGLMLRKSRMSVKEIAFASGFAGSQRMIRSFQRIRQMSPNGYRNQAKR